MPPTSTTPENSPEIPMEYTSKYLNPHSASVAQCLCPEPRNGRKPRNLVISLDGTANQFGDNNSNVVELYSRLVKDEEQLTYYNSGIGTFVKKTGFDTGYVLHLADLMFAINFKNKVVQAYQWLSEHYEHGDKIYLFGFSRGAYQIRVIAGMIDKIGLLHKGNNEQIAFAYGLYMKYRNLSDDEQSNIEELKQFKRALSRPNVRVHFVGAWDTVSSIGLTKGPNLPGTASGMRHVCAFRHALALDELRVKFLPEYANGGGEPGPSPHTKEVWFAGSHSDVGGGHIINLNLNRFGASLRWMSYEAIRHGLRLEPQKGAWEPLTLTSSMNTFYKMMEYLPLRHLSYKDSSTMVFRWHREKPRQIKKGQLIHSSVFETATYTPKASPPLGVSWETFKRNSPDLEKYVERDPYTDASGIFLSFNDKHWDGRVRNEDVDVLERLLSTKIGCQSITEYPDAANILIGALMTLTQQDDESSRQTIPLLVHSLEAFESQPHYPSKYRSNDLDKLWSQVSQRFETLQPALEKIKDIFDSLKQPIFALIVGIDRYSDNTISNLSGCVADARDVEDFLCEDLGARRSDVVILLNENATRTRIVQEMVKLRHNARIAPDSPIIIYFSGHSHRLSDGTAVFLPHDYYKVIGPQPNEPYIRDAELNGLLKQLDKEKGNNITVVLDVVSASAYGGKGYSYSSLDSHVLLAACTEKEVARERAGRGLFTYSLTSLLRNLLLDIDTITYKDVISRLSVGHNQTPNCRGRYDNRILFSTRIPEHRHAFHHVKMVDRSLLLEGGTLHGITNGAHFSIYRTHAYGEDAVVENLVAREVRTVLARLDTNNHTSISNILQDSTAYALQTNAGDGATVSFACQDAGLSGFISQRLSQKSQPLPCRTNIRLVEVSNGPEIVVLKDSHLSRVVIDITDHVCHQHGLHRLPYVLSRDPNIVYSSLRQFAEFFWDLRRTNINPQNESSRKLSGRLTARLTLEAHLLTNSDNLENGPQEPIDPSANIFNGGSINVIVEDPDCDGYEKALGITINNPTQRSFYVWLFAFNMLDLTVDILYKPSFSASSRGADPCLPAGGRLQVGYTLNQHNLPNGIDLGVTYLKAFISSDYGDLSYIEKPLCFDKTAGALREMSASPTLPSEPVPSEATWSRSDMTKPLRLRGGAARQPAPPPNIWDTLVVPIIIKRARV